VVFYGMHLALLKSAPGEAFGETGKGRLV